jgi:hypothetical protein
MLEACCRFIATCMLSLFFGPLFPWLTVPAFAQQTERSTSQNSNLTPGNKSPFEQLSSPDYRERRQAFLDLWTHDFRESKDRIGPFQSNFRSDDAEVSNSLKWLGTLKGLSVEPENITDQLRNLAFVRSGDVGSLVRLASSGEWDQLIRLLELVPPSVRESYAADLDATKEQLSTIFRLAWDAHEEHRIPQLVDLLWPRSQAIAARMLWRDIGAIDLSEVEYRSVNQTGSEDKLVEVFELLQNGQCDEAFRVSLAQHDFDLASRIAMEQGNWAEVREAFEMAWNHREGESRLENLGRDKDRRISPRDAILKPKGTDFRTMDAAKRALLAKWTLNDQAFKESLADLKSSSSGKLDHAAELSAITAVGMIDDALAYAANIDPQEAGEALLLQGKIDEGLMQFDWKDWSAEGVKKWLDEQLKIEPKTPTDEFSATYRLVDLSCTLHRLGETELGGLVDNAVLYWLSGAGMEEAQHRRRLDRSLNEIIQTRWNVATYLWDTEHRRDFALKQLVQLIRENSSKEQREGVLRQLDRPKEGRISWGHFASPVLDWLYDRRRSLAAANVSASSDSNADATKLWQEAVRDFDDLAHGRSPRGEVGESKNLPIRQIGEMLLKDAGTEDHAASSYQLSAIAADLRRFDLVEDWIQIDARREFKQFVAQLETQDCFLGANPQSARLLGEDVFRLELLGRSCLARQDRRRAQLIYSELCKLAPHRLDFALDYANLLESVGRKEEASFIRRRSLSLPIPPKAFSMRNNRSQEDGVERELVILLRHAQRLGEATPEQDWFLADSMNRMEAFLREDQLSVRQPLTTDAIPILQNRVNVQRRLVLARLDAVPSRTFNLRSDLAMLDLLGRSEAALAIAEGDFQTADDAIRRCFQALPQQIETPLELIPWATAAFGRERVVPWLDLYVEAMEAHMKRWPNDTLIGNNLAWLYANLDWKLERAEELCRRVCARLPEDDTYLDTWAEVEFRRGNRDKAVEISSRCRELAPLELHHKKQLARFRVNEK